VSQTAGRGPIEYPALTSARRNPYAVQGQPNLGLDALAQTNVDPTQYMAPMELYDTIWGGML
jgi:hypothetical protein